MARTATKKTTATKPAPKPEVEETDEEAVFGVADVVELIGTKLKKKTTTRELRTLLRKMARDGRLDREIVAGNRARWEFAGPEDPEVVAILEAFEAGELEQDKKEKLDALKERKAAERAAKKAAEEAEENDDDEEEEAPAPKKTSRRRSTSARKPAKKTKPVEADEDDEELEED